MRGPREWGRVTVKVRVPATITPWSAGDAAAAGYLNRTGNGYGARGVMAAGTRDGAGVSSPTTWDMMLSATGEGTPRGSAPAKGTDTGTREPDPEDWMFNMAGEETGSGLCRGSAEGRGSSECAGSG